MEFEAQQEINRQQKVKEFMDAILILIASVGIAALLSSIIVSFHNFIS